jgi:hypothetical protein
MSDGQGLVTKTNTMFQGGIFTRKKHACTDARKVILSAQIHEDQEIENSYRLDRSFNH